MSIARAHPRAARRPATVLQGHMLEKSLPLHCGGQHPQRHGHGGRFRPVRRGGAHRVRDLRCRGPTTSTSSAPITSSRAASSRTIRSIAGAAARVEKLESVSAAISPRAVLYKLEQNYRSTGTILKAANALIANNAGRLGKTLWTSGEDGERIRLYAAFNERDEADFVVNRHPRMGCARRARGARVAVLYRSNAQSRVFEEAFLNARMALSGVRRFALLRGAPKSRMHWRICVSIASRRG